MNLTREGLEKLGIYELRNVARNIGVYSPTLYKKDVLIEKVMAIVLGEEEPYVRKTNQGRPAKQIAGLDDILNIFVPEINPATLYANDVKKQTLFPVSMMQEINGTADNVETFEGYTKILPENYAVVFKDGYFLDNKNTYYITPQLLSSLKLKDGDFVRGEYYVLGSDKPNVVGKIKTVNGEVIENNTYKERQNFNQLDAFYPTKQIKLATSKDSLVDFKVIDAISPIGEGSRVIVNYEQDFDIESFVINLVNVLSLENNLKTTMIATNERPEDISYLKNECTGLKVFDSNCSLENEYFIEQLDLIFNNLVRRVESGDNQILVIKNLDKLINSLKNYYISKLSLTSDEAKLKAVEKVKALSMLSKNTSNGNALTIIAFNCSEKEICELCNNNINLMTYSYKDTNLYVDAINSKSLKANLLLSQSKFEMLKNYRQNVNQENVVEQLLKLL